MNKPSMFYIDLLLILVAVVWGANPAVVKVGVAYMSPMAFNAIRMFFAAVVSCIFLVLSRTHVKMQREDWPKMFMAGVIGFFIFQVAYTIGVSSTTAGNASFILALGPISAALINRVMKNENITLQMLLGILISVGGVSIIIVASGKQLSLGREHFTGSLMMLIAQFTFAVFTVMSGTLVKKYSSYQVVTYSINIACVLFALFAVRDIAAVKWSGLPTAAWTSLLFSGILSVCLANFLWAWGVRILGSTKTSLYNNLPPIFAIITGYILFGETFGKMQISGAILAFLGLYVTRTQQVPFAFLKRKI